MQLCRHNDNLVIIASTAYDFDFTWKGNESWFIDQKQEITRPTPTLTHEDQLLGDLVFGEQHVRNAIANRVNT